MCVCVCMHAFELVPRQIRLSICVEYHQLIVEKSQLHVEDSLKCAREEQDSFMEQFLYLK